MGKQKLSSTLGATLMRELMFAQSKFWVATSLLAASLLIGCGGGNGSGGNGGGSGGSGGAVVPPTPVGLVAAAANQQVGLLWTASTGATSYSVKRSTSSGGPYFQIAMPTATNFTDTGVSYGTKYFYVVSAVNSAGASVNSTEVNATPIATPAELPGPSLSLFANPFYTCVRDYYVATNGSDPNAGTQASPWLTVQNADTAAGGRIAGDCVNVAPGTYSAGVQPMHGGNLASSTGYVVYRCQTLDACIITASGGNAAPAFNISSTGSGPNYLVLDGFEFAASSKTLFGVGAEVYFPNGADTGGTTSHHIWIINSIFHGYGQAGVGTGGGEYLYFLHHCCPANALCEAGK